MNNSTNTKLNIKPFVKWVGGKNKLLKIQNSIISLKQFNNKKMRYIEPFVGGGAVSFYLQPKNAIINDFNGELIATYKILQSKIKKTEN